MTERDHEGGAVDRYLDELFDRLAGTGAAGRRALTEAEDHLRSAVADEMARGMPVGRAEGNAIARFGEPAGIARQLRRLHRRYTLSAGWLLLGMAVLVLSATYLIKAVEIAVLLRLHPVELPPCTGDRATWSECSGSVPALYENLRAGLTVLFAGVIVLVARRLALSRAIIAPTRRRFPLRVAAVFALLGLLLFLVNPTTPLGERLGLLTGFEPFGVSEGMGFWHQVIASGVALLTSVAAMIWYLARNLLAARQ